MTNETQSNYDATGDEQRILTIFRGIILEELKDGHKATIDSLYGKTRDYVLDTLARKMADAIADEIISSEGKNVDSFLKDNWEEAKSKIENWAAFVHDNRMEQAEANKYRKEMIDLGKKSIKTLDDIERTIGALQMTMSSFNEILHMTAGDGSIVAGRDVKGSSATNTKYNKKGWFSGWLSGLNVRIFGTE